MSSKYNKVINPHWFFAPVIGILLLLLDQSLKFWARTNPNVIKEILPGLFGWEYFANPGIAFSIPLPSWMILWVTPFIITGIIFFFFFTKHKTKIDLYAVSCMLAGAISNFIDRLFLGITVDYLRIGYGIINLADLFILFGGIIIIWHYYHKQNRKDPELFFIED